MNAKMYSHKGDIANRYPKNERGCSHCQTKFRCEDIKECQCKKDFICPKCKAKRVKKHRRSLLSHIIKADDVI